MNSTYTPSCLHWHTWRFGVQDLDCVCVICISLPQLAHKGLVYLPFYDFHDPNVSSSLGRGVLAVVNLSLPHTTSILPSSSQGPKCMVINSTARLMQATESPDGHTCFNFVLHRHRQPNSNTKTLTAILSVV
jgi:hypothetical protein